MRTRIAQVAERRARNPEVRIPVLVQVFLLGSYNVKISQGKQTMGLVSINNLI